MKRLNSLLIIFVCIGLSGAKKCPSIPDVNPTPTPTPVVEPTPCPEGQCIIGYTNSEPPMPICGECPPEDPCQGITCSPGSHCNPKTGECIPDPPPANPCPKELAEGAYVYMNNKAYGNGFDSTVRVHGDVAFCEAIHGEAINDCHLEGWPQRVECEYYLLGNNCPVWEYKYGDVVYFCHDNHDALVSCDHYGNPSDRDDPQTPTTGDTLETLQGFEGEPKICGLHRDEFGPMQGYFIIAHGNAQIRACKPDRNSDTCGPWRPFNH